MAKPQAVTVAEMEPDVRQGIQGHGCRAPRVQAFVGALLKLRAWRIGGKDDDERSSQDLAAAYRINLADRLRRSAHLRRRDDLTCRGTRGVQAIADAADPASLETAYLAAPGALINQHGFNLFWFGIVTAVGAVFIWRGSTVAILLAALVGGLADTGYFIFAALSGSVNFVPGTLKTLASSAAIITSVSAHGIGRPQESWKIPARRAEPTSRA